MTPDCSFKWQTHGKGDREVARREREGIERESEKERERGSMEWCQVPKVVYKYL